MSPTLLTFLNLRVVIHTKDHKPAHIHVVGPEGEIRIDLKTWTLMSCRGFSDQTVRKILQFLKPRKDQFLEAWNEIYKDEEKK